MTPFDQFKTDFQNKKVTIFGLGVQGRGVEDALFFQQLGAKVHVTDKKTEPELQESLQQLDPNNFTFTLGEHKESDILDAQLIIRNASVPWNHPLLNLAREKSIPIYMDAQLFFSYANPNAIGITGTRGKTTTATLIHHILQNSHHDKNVILAGNAVHHASLPMLRDHHPDNLYVFELSSWQLQAFHTHQISPPVAVLTNLYPDHLLDRSFEEYVNDKTAIFAYQNPDDHVFINQNTAELSAHSFSSQLHHFSSADVDPSKAGPLKGQHNLENIAAAKAVCNHVGVSDSDFYQYLATFSPPEFRLQKIAELDGVSIINDTTSTTPIATIRALEAYPGSILILGGTSKQLPTQDLVEAINQHASRVILFSGTGTNEVKDQINSDLIVGETDELKQAVNLSLEAAKPGDTVLFSPGFTSFGPFSNEFDRGRQFNKIIKNLKK